MVAQPHVGAHFFIHALTSPRACYARHLLCVSIFFYFVFGDFSMVLATMAEHGSSLGPFFLCLSALILPAPGASLL